MAKKQQAVKPTTKVSPKSPKTESAGTPVQLNVKFLWAIFAVVFALFCFSIFKNIQYPLFWADESMTVVGSQRVLEFGYPKVHDGKNVFYDLRHTDPALGIDKETDAYIGGTSWGHYYFGTIGVKLAEGFNDIYDKTGIIRFTFALAGLIGLLLGWFLIAGIFSDNRQKLLFGTIFFILSLFSVSLALLIKEARYYPLTILLVLAVSGLYILKRMGGKLNTYVFGSLFVISLLLTFFTFGPVYFILLATIGLAEVVVGVDKLLKSRNVKETLLYLGVVIIPLILSLIAVYPLINYFKTFEISEAMAVFNGFGKKMYWENISAILRYFKGFELLWLAVFLKVLMLINTKRLLQSQKVLLSVSGFLTLLFVIYIFLIARVPNFTYTRYLIPIQPILLLSISFDIVVLLFLYGNNELRVNLKTIGLLIVTLIFLIYNINTNSKYLSGHMTELSEPYKGPLDYTIPYILDKYKKTDTIVVATNYEETSYMYYLNCKATVGFIGNNLEEDSKIMPHVISYRKPWGNHTQVFQGFMRQQPFARVAFSVYDSPLNNIPELNFMPAFNHRFKTLDTENEQEKTELYIRR